MSRIAVLGAGTMGHGIAQVCAMAGHDVALADATVEFAGRGLERVRANLAEGVKRGKIEQSAADAHLARITVADSLEAACGGASIIIEAVPEKPELKRDVLTRAEAAAPADAILATNTSSLSIGGMQEWLARPQQCIGLHFFNPVHINRLLEVVRGPQTSDAVVDAAMQLAREIGKEAVLVNDSPGFATSRLGVLLGLEAMRMVEEGVASAADIDKAMELGYRHPMGPLRLTDLVGLDVRLDIARYLHAELGTEQFRPPRILEQMVAEGKLGKKSGQGFYDWGSE
ncbi:MAG TPA: 3-hydroxyacyl-CoA dehydrogenase family protein [Longimicrobiales bacterium]|nr:3-hydroxyacyl-CoA dehydrogenase family protein [Longimicrobiales bacterium]